MRYSRRRRSSSSSPWSFSACRENPHWLPDVGIPLFVAGSHLLAGNATLVAIIVVVSGLIVFS